MKNIFSSLFIVGLLSFSVSSTSCSEEEVFPGCCIGGAYYSCPKDIDLSDLQSSEAVCVDECIRQPSRDEAECSLD